MRTLTALSMALAVTVTACGSAATPTSPTTGRSLTGTWVGSFGFDSSGSMMGSGVTATMMSDATMTLSQMGNAFTGSAHFPGYMGGNVTISGTTTGSSGTFTMTMPTGSMMTSGSCSATATGRFEMDDMHEQLHGVYDGVNSCTGTFSGGQMSMAHR